MADGGLCLSVGDCAAHSLKSANGHKSSEHTVATGRNRIFVFCFCRLLQIIQTVQFQQHDKMDHQPLFKYCSPTVSS